MDIQANENITSEVQKINKITLDIQAILTVIGRRIKSFENGETNRLDLQGTCLQEANLFKAHLEGANLYGAHLEWADLSKAHLEGANLIGTHLEWANLYGAHLEGADLYGAHLEGVNLIGTHLEGAYLSKAHLEGAYLIGTHLEGAQYLTCEQLSKAKTLYKATGFNKELEISLREKYPALFEKPNDDI
jgi:uncharacterized protein YjbI with pentapeptide repeats